MSYKNAIPGDIIMAFTSNVKHPAACDDIVRHNYILIGIVNFFVYEELNMGKKYNKWDGITIQDRWKIFWDDVVGWD